jgi:hypothetical protein
LPEIPQGSGRLFVITPRSGTTHQLDICGREAKWLLGESKRRQRRPGWWWNKDPVVSPVHDDNRADQVEAQLGYVLGRVFLVRSRVGFRPIIQLSR